MSRHDHQQVDDDAPSGQFNGDDMEFAPFMFDPASQPVDVPTSHIGVGEMDMEFEPFMFNQGEALGVPERAQPAGEATAQATAQSEPVAAIRPIQPLRDVPTESEPTASPQPPATEPSDAQASAESPAPTPFAGHEVPMPSYLMPAAEPEPAADAATPYAGIAPLPDWLTGDKPSTGPISQEAHPVTTPDMSTGPVSTGPIQETGPVKSQAASMPVSAPAPAPAPAPVAAPVPVPAHGPTPSAFSGMMGRSRGNTGPLAASLPNASWSDSSLASIEDFSSVLIALHAGKRMRQSGPLNEMLLSQTTAAPSVPTDGMASGAQPSEHRGPAQEQPTIPEWAAQSVAGTADSPVAADSQWEPQLPPDAGSVWPGMAQPQTTMPEGEPLPSWNMNPSGKPPEATSWTAAQAQPAPAPAPTPTPAPATAQPSAAPEASASNAGSTPAFAHPATPELDAIRQVPLDRPLETLESGVSDLLKTMVPTISDGSVKGEDLQFESFMFDQGVPAPLPVLPSMDPGALANLPREVGPAFDPTQYANPVPVEETVEYGDIDAEAFGVPSTGVSEGAGEGGPLPFWLQEQPQPGTASDAGPLAEQSAQQQPGRASSQPTSSAGGAATNDADFGELPPIAPFDFSVLGSDVEDEPFGFNTEELTGFVPGERDPMVVTANLEALADLMGGHPGPMPEIKTPRHAGQGSLGDTDMAMSPVPSPAQPGPKSARAAQRPDAVPAPELESAAYVEDVEDVDLAVDTPTTRISSESSELADVVAAQGDQDSGGWMATATTSLPAEPAPVAAGNMEGSTANADMVVEDMDVAPFDYSQLDLDDGGETPTNYLPAGGTPQGPPTGKLEQGREQRPEDTSGAASAEVWREADGDASLFMPPVTESQAEVAQAAEEAAMSADNPSEHASSESSPGADSAHSAQAGTSQMTNRSPEAGDMDNGHTHSPEAASGQVITEPEQTIFRARVARGAWGSHSAATAPPEPPEPQPEPGSAPTTQQESTDSLKHLRKAARTAVLEPPESEASHELRAEPAAPTKGTAGAQDAGSRVDFEADNARHMPAPGDVMVSGPLPTLAGFEDLAAWIERYPNDMGAHMALASAYTQAGDIDTALRVYRRMLRKPYVSENILAMIQDELQDLEDQAQQYPRYHQVRGDLLVRLGQRRAAIDEYNKLG